MTRPKKSAKRSITSFSGPVVPMTRSLTIRSTISRGATHGHRRHLAASWCDSNKLMRSIESGRLGLSRAIRACLFDLDGVLTRTAGLHATAWKEMFDAFLRARAEETGEPFVPFDDVRDYDEYVDGRPREDGIRTFLAARDIELPKGSPDDPP